MSPKKPLMITKASGHTEPFSFEKLTRSLTSAGADQNTAHQIATEVSQSLFPGVTTQEVYHKAFKLLSRDKRALAARYSLKRAIMDLGPSGFPFEQFIGALLRLQGFETQVSVTFQGRCVSHEVDVVAKSSKKTLLIECKFHNLVGTVCDVKTALYVKARADDIRSTWPAKERAFEFYLYTNTHFSLDAIRYATCAGLGLKGWDYPQGEGIKDMIDHHALYPVTCLTSLSKNDKNKLINAKIVLCAQAYDRIDELRAVGLSIPTISRLTRELEGLLNVENAVDANPVLAANVQKVRSSRKPS